MIVSDYINFVRRENPALAGYSWYAKALYWIFAGICFIVALLLYIPARLYRDHVGYNRRSRRRERSASKKKVKDFTDRARVIFNKDKELNNE